MNSYTFVKRLEEGKSNNLTYSRDGNDGLVTVWKHEELLILTWEECPKGKQYDESAYTRDERHLFERFSDLEAFLLSNDFEINLFAP
ncbi:MAG: hypothetical protein SFX18_12515 [Pirellulales bacterium]|nr:hypothetical protein [Pirellulales bacterium]